MNDLYKIQRSLIEKMIVKINHPSFIELLQELTEDEKIYLTHVCSTFDNIEETKQLIEECEADIASGKVKFASSVAVPA